ncbi:MAG: glycosyltransferase [Fimbriimonadaceae bacterium]|nr:glycosyltransferase [Fimbriimonadaceae bacterium]
MPRTSILLTCFNHLDYIGAAWDSIWAQTDQDFEVIALDDGSTDGTREWLTKQAQVHSDKVTLVFNEKNLGTYATLNVGLERAQGEFVCVFNDDDIWAQEKLSRQIERMNDPKIGLVHTSGWFIDHAGQEHPDKEPLGFPWPSTGTGDQLATLVDHNQIITSSVLVRRACFDELGGFDPAFYGCGDWQMWLRVARNWDIAHVDEPLCFYRVHETNAARNSAKMDDDSWRIREWITSWESEIDSQRSGLKNALAHNWACLGTERALRGDLKSARIAYREAIRRRPDRIKTWARYAATLVAPGFARRWR